ncbi:hypothetical protein CSV72_12460 [Sporosarcina sp. P20a]|nr:hypothetical protein CSV72_12460 [Sporosarcina sp. P20a]
MGTGKWLTGERERMEYSIANGQQTVPGPHTIPVQFRIVSNLCGDLVPKKTKKLRQFTQTSGVFPLEHMDM